ncbi:YceI family protein [Alkalicaulis satelles]|uniref:YceI family protein n=1 Tax=Alkalicaulis satelles TaxID=2609175 RepID=A0A5M6ZMH8_9PROT|nr:YceI family protein [Alkalicaulis satelles]KAA5805115.1 YceI family protein [Alkalicaulis satelles]
MRALLALACLMLTACVSAPGTDPVRLPAGEWELDREHASATWRVRHLGLSWYTARFDELDARLIFDPANPEASELTAIIEAASVSTGDTDFDETLRGGAWLDADRHPQISFRSTRIEVTGETTGRIHGELTLKGVTRPAALETEFYGGLFSLLARRRAIGFGADLVINRNDFNVGRLPPGFIGDEVRVRIEAEFLRTAPE